MNRIMNLIESLQTSLLRLISASGGKGPSCTRLVYLLNGVGALFCAIFSTIAGAMVYCVRGEANTVYWAGVASMWTATLGFGALAKKHQTDTTKAIETAKAGPLHAASAMGD